MYSRILSVFAVTVLLLAACTRDVATTSASAGPASQSVNLIDGFENDPLWSQDSAGDHAEMACVPGDQTEGATALVVRAAAGTRKKVILRKEVDIDASILSGLMIDVRVVSGPAPTMAFALRTVDGTWFESPALVLKDGVNRDLAWDLKLFSAGDAAAWVKGASKLERLMLLVMPTTGDCTVAFDNLRGNGAWRWRVDPAELRAVEPPQPTARRFDPVQLSFAVAWPDESRAMAAPAIGTSERLFRRMVAGGAWITAPDGERWWQPAACVGITTDGGRPVNRYVVRFSPDRAGAWAVQAGIPTGHGCWSWAATAGVTVAPEAGNPGPVRIDPRDPHWLSRADGSFFWPLGMNVGWAGDYRPWLTRMQEDGCTAVRVWMCPWSNPLDVAGNLQTVNQASAATIDSLLDTALAKGLTVQLCLNYHGMLKSEWEKNPYNLANGGVITDPREFWIDAKAKAVFRKQLDYVSARWGHHPALLAWEMWNEADIGLHYDDDDIVEWHREMCAYLAKIDRHRHLITTSLAGQRNANGLWRVPDVNLVQPHYYERESLRAIAAAVGDIALVGKPGWPAELSRYWQRGGEQADTEGRFLHQALWWSWVHGCAGSSWAWWWDTQVQNNGLTKHHAALARFIAGEDLRGATLTSVSAAAEGINVVALSGVDRSWVFAADQHATAPASGAPAAMRARRVRLSGFAAGAWSIERWDPLAGTCVATLAATVADDGVLEVELPAGANEAAWKLRRSARLVPEIRLP